MITLYHLGVSQSDRIVWIMEELKIPYQIKWYDRGENMLAPAEYRALHPVGTSPIIKDDDLVLSESAAIVEYLSQRYGNGSLSVAPSESNYPDYLYWMQFNANVQAMFFARLLNENIHESDNPIATVVLRREEAYFQFLNDRLGESDYLAGDKLTCADIMAVFNLTALPLFGGRPIDDLPNVQTYLERICQRPAYIKAMEIAGPEAKSQASAS